MDAPTASGKCGFTPSPERAPCHRRWGHAGACDNNPTDALVKAPKLTDTDMRRASAVVEALARGDGDEFIALGDALQKRSMRWTYAGLTMAVIWAICGPGIVGGLALVAFFLTNYQDQSLWFEGKTYERIGRGVNAAGGEFKKLIAKRNERL